MAYLYAIARNQKIFCAMRICFVTFAHKLRFHFIWKLCVCVCIYIVNNVYFFFFHVVVPHDTEYFLITGAPFMDPKLYPSILNLEEARWTEADRNLSQFFMASWANFAKTGYEILYFSVLFFIFF